MSSANNGRVATGEPRAWVEMFHDPEFDDAMSQHPYSKGFIPAMGRLLASHPSIGPAFAALYDAIMFSEDGALARAEREMVAAAATAAQDCFY